MATIGSNHFENVSFPLIFENRYFLFEEEEGKDLWTTFFVQDGEPILEILKNEPHQNPFSEVTTNPTGIITVADRESKKFLYKIRPGNQKSSIFGTINGEETEIKITDKEIKIGTNSFQNNRVMGLAVGIIVNKDGGIGFGAGLPPEIQRILTK